MNPEYEPLTCDQLRALKKRVGKAKHAGIDEAIAEKALAMLDEAVPSSVRVILPWRMLAQSNHRLVSARGQNRLILAPAYRKAKEAAETAARAQVRITPYAGPVRMTVAFYEPDKRRRDPSNLLKLCEDCLTGIAYEDDSQICEMTWKRAGVDRTVPRAEITVEPIAQERAA